MVNCFREEEPAGVAGVRLIIDPSEKVFVQEIQQREGDKRDGIDDRRYDRIAQRDYNQLSHCGEESTPFGCARRVLGFVHRTWAGRKECLFDIVLHQRPNLKEAKGCSGKTLKNDKTMTIIRQQSKQPSDNTYVRKNVEDLDRFRARSIGANIGLLTRLEKFPI